LVVAAEMQLLGFFLMKSACSTMEPVWAMNCCLEAVLFKWCFLDSWWCFAWSLIINLKSEFIALLSKLNCYFGCPLIIFEEYGHACADCFVLMFWKKPLVLYWWILDTIPIVDWKHLKLRFNMKKSLQMLGLFWKNCQRPIEISWIMDNCDFHKLVAFVILRKFTFILDFKCLFFKIFNNKKRKIHFEVCFVKSFGKWLFSWSKVMMHHVMHSKCLDVNTKNFNKFWSFYFLQIFEFIQFFCNFSDFFGIFFSIFQIFQKNISVLRSNFFLFFKDQMHFFSIFQISFSKIYWKMQNWQQILHYFEKKEGFLRE